MSAFATLCLNYPSLHVTLLCHVTKNPLPPFGCARIVLNGRPLIRLYHTLFQIKEILKNTKEEQRLSNIDKGRLHELIEFLCPFEKETKQVEGDKDPNLLYVLFIYARLRKHCEPQRNDQTMTSRLRARGRKYLDAKI